MQNFEEILYEFNIKTMCKNLHCSDLCKMMIQNLENYSKEVMYFSKNYLEFDLILLFELKFCI